MIFITEFSKRNEEIATYLRDILKVWEVNLVSILKRGKVDGYIARHVDCEGAASYIIASYLGMRTLLSESTNRQLKYNYVQQLKLYFNAIEERRVVA